MEYSDLKGKTVMVTGAGQGIGKAIAQTFASQGCRLIPVFRSKEPEIEVGSDTPEPIPVKCDVRDIGQFEKRLREFEARGLGVDVLVNNAGVIRHGMLLDLTEEDWNHHFDTNLKAVLFLSQLLAKHMKERNGGAIVNISSFNTHIASIAESLYAVTKCGLTMLTRCMAAEWAPHGIRVNAVSPGMIPTPMSREEIEQAPERLLSYISMNRFGRPEDIANAAVFLASDAAAYITGHNMDVNGGKALVQNPTAAWEMKE